MRAAAALVAGLAAAAIMAVSVPWDIDNCVAPCGMSVAPPDVWTVVGLGIYLAIPAAILTAVLVAILGIRPTSASEAAVRAALGEAASAGVRRAALTGLRDGLAVAAAVYCVAGAAHVAIETTHGWDAFTTHTDFWLIRAVECLMAALALAVAHVLSAWRPRRSPVERLREEAEPPRPVRRRAMVATAAIGAVAAGVVVGLAVAQDGQPHYVTTNTAGIAWAIAFAACAVLGIGAVLPWARGVAPRFVALAAGLADGMGLSRLAAVLTARASSPTRATGRAVMAVGGIAFAMGAVMSGPAGVELSDRAVMVLATDRAAEDVTESLEAIDGVFAVVRGERLSSFDAPNAVVAIDPEALREADPALAQALISHPTAALSGATNVLDVTTEAFAPTGIVPLAGGWYSYVAESAASGPTYGPAYLIYAAEGADLKAIDGAVSRLPVGASQVEIGTLAGSAGGTGGTLFLLLLLTAVLAPVAIGAVRAGARESATLAALGADARTVRTALGVEGTVLAATAVAAGGSAGVLMGASMTMLARARHSLTGVITESYLGVALESVPWGLVVTGGVAMVAIYAVLTAVAAMATHLESPAEALRDGLAGAAR
ncbi:hypothetical protein [Demequina iriomotensis]|uniref:hypothetical protein n=1 Tax=Demequina iriomotensis TaxID=1536641 RepID=UPI0007829D59|nr:hypothetical protein [Demequina iriomotensis]